MESLREALRLVLETDGRPKNYTVEFDKMHIEA